jgi:hypothetical protein
MMVFSTYIELAFPLIWHGTSANGKEVEFEKVMERIVESN